MVRKVTSSKTPEQRRAEADRLHDTISEQVEALRESEAWTRFLQFAQSFHQYSLGNVLLILAQQPGATHVAGYKTWQKLERQVRRGECGIRIFGGRDIVETVQDARTGEDTEQRRARFFPVSVFDIAQTDPTDPDAASPAELAHRLTGDDPAGILDAVADYLHGRGWTLQREPIPGETNGLTMLDGSHRVLVDVALSPAQAAKTALHEAAHVLLHADEDRAEYAEHRGVKETEAESVAYIVAGTLGLDTSTYSIGYIAGWSHGDTDLIRSTAQRVLTTAHRLADALTPDQQHQAA